jgi:hypothetical protein
MLLMRDRSYEAGKTLAPGINPREVFCETLALGEPNLLSPLFK